MRISSSRCTTITNGRITSSVQRPKSSSAPISIGRLPSPSPSPACSSSQNALTVNNEIIIRRTRHSDDPSIRYRPDSTLCVGPFRSSSYTCDLCSCRCWSIRNIHRHVRLHADVRPFTCDLCQLKFKSYGNLMKHFKTSRHQLKKENNERNWSIDAQAMNEQSNSKARERHYRALPVQIDLSTGYASSITSQRSPQVRVLAIVVELPLLFRSTRR